MAIYFLKEINCYCKSTNLSSNCKITKFGIKNFAITWFEIFLKKWVDSSMTLALLAELQGGFRFCDWVPSWTQKIWDGLLLLHEGQLN